MGTTTVQETPAQMPKVLLVLLDKETIKGQQDTIRGNLLSLDVLVHSNAVQCLMHAEKHGDTSLMTRLLTDILDDKTGYRRQGLIGWMRAFSPMELNGKKITLSGMIDGKKRPFQIEKANNTPFYLAKEFAEKEIKPIWQDTLLSKFDTMVREFEGAWGNTKNGKPIDPTKPFYDGLHGAQILSFIEKGKEMRSAIKEDGTRDVRINTKKLKEAEVALKAEKEQAA